MKFCSKCKVEKPETEFCKVQSNKDGLNFWCRSCDSKKAKCWWKNLTPEVQAARAVKMAENAKIRYDADPIAARKKQYAWRKANPDNARRSRRRCLLKTVYRLTEVAFEELIQAQNNKCKICRRDFKKTPHIDHCHLTGKLRGLLCTQCNTALGKFQDSEEVLTSAIEYLRNNKNK